MKRILACAIREYKATALTKAFIFGTFVLPVVLLGVLFLAGATNLFEKEARALKGTVSIADATRDQFVASGLEMFFSPEEQQKRLEERKHEFKKAVSESSPIPVAEQQAEMSAALAAGRTLMDVELQRIPYSPEAIDAEKERMRAEDGSGPLMVIAVDDRALELTPEELGPDEARDDEDAEPAGAFELFHGKDVDGDRVDEVRREVQTLIVNERLELAGLVPEDVRAMMESPSASVRTMTAQGESDSLSDLLKILPFIFFMLLWISVMTGGQYLLMSTIEEKSSRVMEVLLSAISPSQLMIGKILGQAGVGFTLLGIYVGVGLLTANQFDVLSQLPVDAIVWMVVYFIMAYFIIASMMAAVGSAVSDMREANALLTPVMMVLIIPFILWVPISQNPMSLLARVVSFIPPFTPFAMVMRTGQPGVEIPTWEIVLTTGLGLLGVVVMVWGAVKIFRVGVLMYGQPPSLLGLLKWVRYA